MRGGGLVETVRSASLEVLAEFLLFVKVSETPLLSLLLLLRKMTILVL
jgi:hypothetical protein